MTTMEQPADVQDVRVVHFGLGPLGAAIARMVPAIHTLARKIDDGGGAFKLVPPRAERRAVPVDRPTGAAVLVGAA